jgi:hypothetical protein
MLAGGETVGQRQANINIPSSINGHQASENAKTSQLHKISRRVAFGSNLR